MLHKVLESSKEPTNCGELIDAMAKESLWSSPDGWTPAATLYSVILPEVNVKGKGSRRAESSSLYSARFELEKARERASFCSKSHFCNELGHRV